MSELKRMLDENFFKDRQSIQSLPVPLKAFIDSYIGFESFKILVNYSSSGYYARWFPVELSAKLYEEIAAGKWDQVLKSDEKIRTVTLEILQIDILSKVMMAIEDLSVFASCFPANIKGLHDIIYKDSNFSFIDRKIQSSKFDEIYGYPSAEALNIQGSERAIYQKLVKNNASILKGYFLAIKEFKETYYRAYIGYKHSYAGIMPYFKIASSNKAGAEVFNEIILIGEKGKPLSFDNGIIILQGKREIDSYLEVLSFVHTALRFLVNNWLEKIKYCDTNTLPLEIIYSKDILPDDIKIIEEIWRKQKVGTDNYNLSFDIGKISEYPPKNIVKYNFIKSFQGNYVNPINP